MVLTRRVNIGGSMITLFALYANSVYCVNFYDKKFDEDFDVFYKVLSVKKGGGCNASRQKLILSIDCIYHILVGRCGNNQAR